jgi:hypothetical protein
LSSTDKDHLPQIEAEIVFGPSWDSPGNTTYAHFVRVPVAGESIMLPNRARDILYCVREVRHVIATPGVARASVRLLVRPYESG